MTRERYAEDATLRDEVLDLLATVFGSWFADCETTARSRGLCWERASTPFVVRDGGRVVAHAGILEIPLVLAGEERVVAGLHAVATHPDHRGRGHMRRVVEAALRHCDARYDTVVLTAGEPSIYARFGFRARTEHRFVCTAPPACGTKRHRPLDWAREGDVHRLRRLLAEREPVSRQLGVVRDRDVFLFDTALTTDLHVFEELDLVAWVTRDGGVLRLHDLVASRVPALTEILCHVQGPVDRVEAYFTPDRLDGAFDAEPCLFDGEEWFMTRGPFVPPEVRVTLPRSARC